MTLKLFVKGMAHPRKKKKEKRNVPLLSNHLYVGIEEAESFQGCRDIVFNPWTSSKFVSV